MRLAEYHCKYSSKKSLRCFYSNTLTLTPVTMMDKLFELIGEGVRVKTSQNFFLDI